MADQKISLLTEVTTLASTDVLPVVNGGATKRVQVANLQLSLGGAWASWVPTWTNLTVGNGTVVAKYNQIGKLVIARLSLTLGSTSAVSGSVSFTLPITQVSYAGSAGLTTIGHCWLRDASAGQSYEAMLLNLSTTTALIGARNTSGTYAQASVISSTVPFTWTTSDEITAQFYYEAA